MKKLMLHLDDLAVESFDTSAVEKERGTVVGEQCSCQGSCPGQTCQATCAYTCDDYTCAESCGGTCAGFTCLESCGGTCWNPRCQDSNICP